MAQDEDLDLFGGVGGGNAAPSSSAASSSSGRSASAPSADHAVARSATNPQASSSERGFGHAQVCWPPVQGCGVGLRAARRCRPSAVYWWTDCASDELGDATTSTSTRSPARFAARGPSRGHTPATGPGANPGGRRRAADEQPCSARGLLGTGRNACANYCYADDHGGSEEAPDGHDVGRSRGRRRVSHHGLACD